MKTNMRNASICILSVAMFCLAGCTQRGDAEKSLDETPANAAVSSDGSIITFPQSSPGLRQLLTTTARRRSTTLSVVAPARVVASIAAREEADSGRIILFESTDITSLYSQYKQATTNASRTTKNLARVRDMFGNHTATGKDLTDAETEYANARAALGEFESKLRTAGFNPAELDKAPAGTVWLMCDVTESQLPDVEQGEDVDIAFTSFPGRKLTGRAVAVGEVVDPMTRTVKVRVTTGNPKGKLLPGMFARVDFGDPISNVYVLPPSAVTTVEGADYVFVEKEPGTFERRRIHIRASSQDGVVLQDGLTDGDHIVTSGVMLLKGLSFGY